MPTSGITPLCRAYSSEQPEYASTLHPTVSGTHSVAIVVISHTAERLSQMDHRTRGFPLRDLEGTSQSPAIIFAAIGNRFIIRSKADIVHSQADFDSTSPKFSAWNGYRKMT